MKSILPINLAFDRVVGNLAQLPFDEGIEIAVCGRSNSGKSSIINALGNNKKLAKTSKTPGRTQTVNFFTINDDPQTKLVDLPGYGYAKASKQDQNNWAQLVESYLLGRQCLKKVVVIMDIRHPFKEADLVFLDFRIVCAWFAHMLHMQRWRSVLIIRHALVYIEKDREYVCPLRTSK